MTHFNSTKPRLPKHKQLVKKTLPPIFLAIPVLLAGLACQMLSGGADPTSTSSLDLYTQPTVPSPSPQATATETPLESPDNSAIQPVMPGDAIALVVEADRKTANQYPRTLRAEVLSAGETNASLITFWYAAVDQYHLEVINPDGTFFEGIVITQTVYVNQSGAWETFTGEIAAGFIQTFNTASAQEALEPGKISNLQISGNEAINGVETIIYSFDLSLLDGTISRVLIWIGVVDGLVYQYVGENSSGVKTEGYYDFTSPVVIEPPE